LHKANYTEETEEAGEKHAYGDSQWDFLDKLVCAYFFTTVK